MGGAHPKLSKKKDVFWRGTHPFIAADHVGDLHETIVDDSCEVIGGEAIRFKKDLVVDIGPRSRDASFDGVFVDAFAVRGTLRRMT